MPGDTGGRHRGTDTGGRFSTQGDGSDTKADTKGRFLRVDKGLSGHVLYLD